MNQPFTNEHARDRVLAAFKDHGVEVVHIGTVEWGGEYWAIKNWDVQGVPREDALRIARESLCFTL